MRLYGSLTPVSALTDGDRTAMLALMQRHYENVRVELFERDLDEKQWVIQVSSVATGELCGFSTQMLLDVCVDGQPVKALFSGDTIMDREYWGDQTLMVVGGRLAVSLIAAYPNCELYWFLISAGYKTYRFLPVFFREFYPRFDTPTPAVIQSVIDHLSRARFGDRYDRGIVRTDASQYYLRDGIAELSPRRLRDPHVRFFAAQNPGHALGDELCCIASLSEANFTTAARRVLRQAGRQAVPLS